MPGIDAPAKINLALHVTGRRADGFHLIESLVVFTELSDRGMALLSKSVWKSDFRSPRESVAARPMRPRP